MIRADRSAFLRRQINQIAHTLGIQHLERIFGQQAILDVFQQGRLVASQNGFGLLTSKRLLWFTAAGT